MRNQTVIIAVLACILLASACGGDAEVTSADTGETGGAESDEAVGSENDVAGDTPGEVTDSSDEGTITTEPDDTSGPGALAAELLATDQGVDRAAISVVEVEEVQWPNGSLGCPKPDFVYTQAVVPGIRVVLEAAGETYSYHGTTEADLFLCDQPA